ncbi:MAG: Hpt domain-containing protein, partial [Acidiferrobacterales bacterium]
MSTSSKIDPNTLGWVKAEIDESLRQAHVALESFAQNPSNDTRLRFSVTHLHQVVGTLQMVELDGAAMLAREAEDLADAVLNEQVEARESNLELLSRAILLLPDYLGGLQFGRPDTPLKLLPLMNELRAARQLEPIAEDDLFAPDLSVRPPPRPEDKPKLSEDEYTEVAQKLRPAFQLALLNWLRDSSDTKALATIQDSVAALQQLAPIGVIEQLFWVAGGLLEALTTGGLESTNERKKLVARLDQQIKRLIDGGEKGLLRATSEALVKSMLFQLGTAGSNGPKVTQLRRAFELDQLLSVPVGDTITVTDLPEPKTVESVSTALSEEIHAAQELLAAYFDLDRKDVGSLEPLLEQLHRFSSTVDLLGILELKALVDKLLEVATAVVQGRLKSTEEVSMRMAQALLLVENCSRDIWAPNWKRQIDDWTSALQGLLSPEAEGAPGVQGIEVGEVSDTEFEELVSVVASEIHVTMTKVEELVEEFAAATSELSRLDDIPDYLGQIHGALQMLGEERALELAELIGARIDELRTGKLVPTAAVLDALAVCVGTLTAYAEGLQHGRTNIDDLMDAATNDMEAASRAAELGELDPNVLLDSVQSYVSQWLENTTDTEALGAALQGLDDVTMLAVSQGQERIERIGSETNALLAIVAEDPLQLSQEIADTLARSVEALVVLGKEQLRPGTAAEPAPAPVVTAAPVPQAPVGDEVETAAPVERQPTHEPAPSAPAPPAEIPEQAAPPEPEAISPVVPQPSAEREPVPVPTDEQVPAAAPAPDIDPEMLEIFADEAREVLETVGSEFPTWRSDPENSDALLEVRRGFHTLKGSGRMVGATEIGELAWAVENVLNKVRDKKLAASDAIFGLLETVQAVLPGMIDQLQGAPGSDADVDALRQAANALANGDAAAVPGAQSVQQRRPPAPAEQVEGVPAADALPKLELALLRIFTGEARGHLDTVKNEIAACRESGGHCLVTTALLRATHTLAGSARSIGLRPMAVACSEIEDLLETLQEAGIPLEDSHLVALDDMVTYVSELLDVLNDDTKSSEQVTQRLDDLAKRAHSAVVALPTPEAAVQSATADAAAKPEPAQVPEPKEPPVPVSPVEETQPISTPMPAPPPASVAALPAMDEEIDPELVDVFLEEAVDLLGSIEQALRRWRTNQSDNQAIDDLKRALHTLKGGARMASAMSVAGLAHNTEDLLKRVEEGQLTARAELFDLLDEVHDALVMLVDQIRQARPLSDVKGLNAKVARILAGGAIDAPKPAVASAAEEARAPDEATDEPRTKPADEALADRRTGDDSELEPVRERRDRRGQVRVRTNVLTDLVNYAGEVSISRARMEQQVYGLRDNLIELNRNVVRFRDQIRDLEIQSESQILYRTEQTEEEAVSSGFDPLELDRYSRLQQLSRTLGESLHDLATIQSNLQTYAGEAESTLQQQARINANLQEGLMRTRMIAFSTQAARLRHIARQTGRELGKRVELQITGTNVGVDRTVLERMMGPFEHMIRNSIDHGIESGDERSRAGKPLTGTITIDTSQEGTEIVISFSDDGHGLDTGAIRRRAVERGFISEDSDLSDEELIQFILVAGFSTADEVTHLSGRGVGMDVVENEVRQLSGSMAVNTTTGAGTTFTIRLPVTLSITQALLVQVGDQTFAIPLSAVNNIIEVPTDSLNISTGKTPLLNYEDQVYSFMHVGQRLGIGSELRNG